MFLVITLQGYSQHLLAEDLEKSKIVKVKFGKELSIITKTDTLDFYDSVYNESTKAWEDVWTGYWYLSKINKADKTITLWNNLSEETQTLATADIKKLIFKREDRGIHRKILLGACFGGVVWAAAAKNNTQSIAAISLTLASAAYLAGTVNRTRYREYKLLGIE